MINARFSYFKKELAMEEIKCWYCKQAIHPLDEFHHLWCHGNSWSAYKEETHE